MPPTLATQDLKNPDSLKEATAEWLKACGTFEKFFGPKSPCGYFQKVIQSSL